MKRHVITQRCPHFKSRRFPAGKNRLCREDPGPDRGAPQKRRDGTTVITAIREYLSDILGAFMPGIYFSFNLFLSIPAALLLLVDKNLTWKKIIDFITGSHSATFQAILQAVMPFAVFAFCLFSYIIGSVFYRKDIKEPDTASAIETYNKSSAEEKKGLAFDFKDAGGKPFKLLAGLYKRMKFRVDFPYARLKRYLKTRNYTHLAEHIPWSGDENEKKNKQQPSKTSIHQRSKMFINILKARIHRYAPEEMPEIEKNEAHIRLMNSLWYAAKTIRNITAPVFTGVIVSYISSGLIEGKTFFESLKNLLNTDFAFSVALFSAIQLLIAWYIRRSIRQYFHYMRVREIMFILEIADTISRHTEINIFEGLEPEKKESGKHLETKKESEGNPGPDNRVLL
jgi:hypothetical protein